MPIPKKLCHGAEALVVACGLAVAAALAPAVGQAEEEMLTVSGQLTYRERIAVSPNAVMQVTIEDISRADAPSDTLAEFSSDLEQVPAPFTLNVPREEMRSRGRYGLRGTVRDGDGVLLWTTDSVTPIDPSADTVDVGTVVMVRVGADARSGQQVYRCDETAVLATFNGNKLVLVRDGVPQDLERVRTASGARYTRPEGDLSFWVKGDAATLYVDGESLECSGAPTDEYLTNGEWVVEDIAGRGVVDRSHTSMSFSTNGRIAGRAGCNDYTGEWRADGRRLEIIRLALTRKACAPALDRQEVEFVEILESASGYRLTPSGALVVSAGAPREITARQQ